MNNKPDMDDTGKTPIRVELADEAATAALAARVSARARPGDVFALSGPLGSGKTVFARAFINARTRTPQEVPSPTFTLVQGYEFPNAGGASRFIISTCSGSRTPTKRRNWAWTTPSPEGFP